VLERCSIAGPWGCVAGTAPARRENSELHLASSLTFGEKCNLLPHYGLEDLASSLGVDPAWLDSELREINALRNAIAHYDDEVKLTDPVWVHDIMRRTHLLAQRIAETPRPHDVACPRLVSVPVSLVRPTPPYADQPAASRSRIRPLLTGADQLPRRLCKPEVTGSIPVRSIKESAANHIAEYLAAMCAAVL
jgi:hypothetical protein